MIWLLVLGGLLALYGAVLFLIVWVSVHPKRIPVFISPGSLEVPQEDVEFTTSDGILIRAWWVPAAGAKTAVIYSHGYLMNRSELTPVAAKLWREGCSGLLLDLRAHGRSGGKITGLGVHEKAEVTAAMAWVRSRHPETKVVLMGSSMGCAASVLAVEDDRASADALVLDSAYADLADASLGWWRFLGGKVLERLFYPTLWIGPLFVGYRPQSIDLAASLRRIGPKPTLLLHGDRDVLATPANAQRNAEAAGASGTIVWFEGCDHSEGRWIQPAKYYDSLLGFLRQHDLIEGPKPS